MDIYLQHTKPSNSSIHSKRNISANDLTLLMCRIILPAIVVSAAIRAASASDAGTKDEMGSDNRFLGIVAFRRGIALLALALLVMSTFAKPAIPNLAERASPVSDTFLSEVDQRTDPVTMPAPWPSALSSTAVVVIARALGESARGFPPIKKSMPLITAESQVAVRALTRAFRPDADRHSSIQISAVGSARAPTGPPLPIA
ncbi:MAG: hypothetical protein R3F54_22805 [Alphaproteobacteria bacterium]